MGNEKDYSVAAEVVDKFNLTDCRCDGITLTHGAMANLARRIANALATVRAEEQRNFVNNIAAVLDADDIEAFTALIMKAKASPGLNSESRSALKSEAEIRAEEKEAAWRDAIQIAEAESFERRMAYCVLDALRAATENRKGE